MWVEFNASPKHPNASFGDLIGRPSLPLSQDRSLSLSTLSANLARPQMHTVTTDRMRQKSGSQREMNHQHLLRSSRNTKPTRLKVCQDTPAAALIQLSVASSRGVRDKDEEEALEDGNSSEENLEESIPGGGEREMRYLS